MSMRKRKKRILIVLIVFVCLITTGIISFVAVQRYINGFLRRYAITLETAPQADAILILGAQVHDNSRPSLVLKERLLYGLELYNNGNAPRIIVSGDHGSKEYNEVGVMKNFLVERGVPAEVIFMDHAGFNTYDSMYRARDIFQVESLLISTQNFHMARSLYIARRLGIEAYGYPSEDKPIYPMRRFRFRESLARVKAFWDVEIRQRPPRHLGDAIPITGCGTLTAG